MTTVAHSIVGLSLGVACMPARWSRSAKAALLLVFVLLANLPDWPLPHWGHYDYRFSHSLLCTVVVAGAIAGAACLWFKARQIVGGTALAAGGTAAVLSHLLLDSFYNDNMGVMIGWPFSKFYLNFSLPWFSILPNGWELTSTVLRIVMIEVAFYAPLLALCLLARALILRRQAAKIGKET